MNTPAESKEEVLQRLRGTRQELAALGVTAIGLFGSFVTGRQTETSDVDILVDFGPADHCFDNFMELSFFLESLFGRRVELVTRDSLSPYIGPHILREVERVPLVA
jgi:predicted nucleotidyltransferase